MQLSDRLLLLVGSNPLPNALAAHHLLAEQGTAVLLHTWETDPVASRLKSLLESWHLKSRKIPIERATPHSVYSGVFEAFRGYQPGETVGLHYTGGTKSMAVHAYRAFLLICQEEGFTPHTSYLDAGTLRIQVDPANPSAPGGGSSRYTGLEPELSFENLMRLHGWRLQKGKVGHTEPRMPSLAAALGDAYSRNGANEDWSKWKESWRKKWQEAGKARPSRGSVIALQDARVKPLPEGEAFASVRQAFNTAGYAANGPNTFGALADALGFESDLVALGHWLDGTWLEALVLDALQSLASKWDLHEVAANLHVEASDTNNGPQKRPHFEFDVAALRGSQLFAFSCSTDTANARLKTKLFEAQVRARQFGGDQARVALVCPHHTPEAIEAEARSALNDRRLRVFGQRDLRSDRLRAALDAWIGEQIGTPS